MPPRPEPTPPDASPGNPGTGSVRPLAQGRFRGHRESGFSLLEILVAFAVLSISLGVLLRIFGGGGRIAATADEYSRAILVAESLLATAGVETPLAPGETRGEVDETYRWTLRVEPYPLDQILAEAGPSLGFKPYWVDLSVEWGPEDDARAFDLRTLRLLPERRGGLVQ
jgi:general secretion pathway protein I